MSSFSLYLQELSSAQVHHETELREKFTHLLSQISVFSNLNLTKLISSSKSNSTSNNNHKGDSGDEWVERVVAEVKKTVEGYEGKLAVMRQQLEETRERELLLSSNKTTSNNNKLISNLASSNTSNNSTASNNGTTVKKEVHEEDEEVTNGSEMKNGNGSVEVPAPAAVENVA